MEHSSNQSSEKSLQQLSDQMVAATQEFAVKFNIEKIARATMNRKSSTIEFKNADGQTKKFSAVYIGVLDRETDIFYWGDSLDVFSNYTRNTCTQLISVLEKT